MTWSQENCPINNHRLTRERREGDFTGEIFLFVINPCCSAIRDFFNFDFLRVSQE